MLTANKQCFLKNYLLNTPKLNFFQSRYTFPIKLTNKKIQENKTDTPNILSPYQLGELRKTKTIAVNGTHHCHINPLFVITLKSETLFFLSFLILVTKMYSDDFNGVAWQVVAIHWNPGTEEALQVRHDDVEPFYKAYTKFWNIMHRKENQV